MNNEMEEVFFNSTCSLKNPMNFFRKLNKFLVHFSYLEIPEEEEIQLLKNIIVHTFN